MVDNGHQKEMAFRDKSFQFSSMVSNRQKSSMTVNPVIFISSLLTSITDFVKNLPISQSQFIAPDFNDLPSYMTFFLQTMIFF